MFAVIVAVPAWSWMSTSLQALKAPYAPDQCRCVPATVERAGWRPVRRSRRAAVERDRPASPSGRARLAGRATAGLVDHRLAQVRVSEGMTPSPSVAPAPGPSAPKRRTEWKRISQATASATTREKALVSGASQPAEASAEPYLLCDADHCLSIRHAIQPGFASRFRFQRELGQTVLRTVSGRQYILVPDTAKANRRRSKRADDVRARVVEAGAVTSVYANGDAFQSREPDDGAGSVLGQALFVAERAVFRTLAAVILTDAGAKVAARGQAGGRGRNLLAD